MFAAGPRTHKRNAHEKVMEFPRNQLSTMHSRLKMFVGQRRWRAISRRDCQRSATESAGNTVALPAEAGVPTASGTPASAGSEGPDRQFHSHLKQSALLNFGRLAVDWH